jgi:glycosyltransferase involved in cell wall biosynthesis
MTKYYLKYEIADELKFNAGGKAVEDCNAILESKGYLPFIINVKLVKNKLIKSARIFKLLKLFKLNSEDTIIIPHPLGLMHHYIDVIHLIHRIKKFKIYYLVHDLTSLRDPEDTSCQYLDSKMLKDADLMFAHNDTMKQYMKNIRPKLNVVSLEIFDYLGEANTTRKSLSCTLSIAGNLSEEKAQYLYHAEKINKNISINLYGGNYNEIKIDNPNFHYFGKFPPEDIPKVFSEGFGLIWDGPSIETCSGNMGNYLRYNDPHKLSLYLSAGLPVVVWEQSAVKEFVLGNNVGISVENINEFYEKYQEITEEEYRLMCRNANEIAKKLHQGYYLKSAINQAENYLSKVSNK